jgi:hypothetical protein
MTSLKAELAQITQVPLRLTSLGLASQPEIFHLPHEHIISCEVVHSWARYSGIWCRPPFPAAEVLRSRLGPAIMTKSAGQEAERSDAKVTEREQVLKGPAS